MKFVIAVTVFMFMCIRLTVDESLSHIFSSRAFCQAAPSVWNCLPAELTNNCHLYYLLTVILNLIFTVDRSVSNAVWSSAPVIYHNFMMNLRLSVLLGLLFRISRSPLGEIIDTNDNVNEDFKLMKRIVLRWRLKFFTAV